MSGTSALRPLLLALWAAGCGTLHAPRGAVPTPVNAQRETFGGWAIVSRTAAAGKPVRVEGELLAVSSDSMWLLQDSSVLAIAATDLQRAQVTGYNSEPGTVITLAGLGVLSTLSHGFYLVLTAPVWLLVGATASTAQAKLSRIESVKGDLLPLAVYARFPQGLPEGVDRTSLRKYSTRRVD